MGRPHCSVKNSEINRQDSNTETVRAALLESARISLHYEHSRNTSRTWCFRVSIISFNRVPLWGCRFFRSNASHLKSGTVMLLKITFRLSIQAHLRAREKLCVQRLSYARMVDSCRPPGPLSVSAKDFCHAQCLFIPVPQTSCPPYPGQYAVSPESHPPADGALNPLRLHGRGPTR